MLKVYHWLADRRLTRETHGNKICPASYQRDPKIYLREKQPPPPGVQFSYLDVTLSEHAPQVDISHYWNPTEEPDKVNRIRQVQGSAKFSARCCLQCNLIQFVYLLL